MSTITSTTMDHPRTTGFGRAAWLSAALDGDQLDGTTRLVAIEVAYAADWGDRFAHLRAPSIERVAGLLDTDRHGVAESLERLESLGFLKLQGDRLRRGYSTHLLTLPVGVDAEA